MTTDLRTYIGAALLALLLTAGSAARAQTPADTVGAASAAAGEVPGEIGAMPEVFREAPGEICAIPGEAGEVPERETPASIQDRYRQRGIIDMKNVFVPRGQWILGATVSYSTHTNRDYTFLVIEDIDSRGYTFRVSPMVAYALRDNMALGVRGIYSRTNLTIDKADLTFGDEETGTEIKVDGYKSVKHTYTVAAIWRQYIPLGGSKRFALFNEIQLGAGGTQSVFAAGEPVKGTYESGYTLSLGISPGLIAFATNDVAIEVNVGVMGLNYTSVKQVHNQVTVGHRSTSNMNFKVNIFSIGLGVSFYL